MGGVWTIVISIIPYIVASYENEDVIQKCILYSNEPKIET